MQLRNFVLSLLFVIVTTNITAQEITINSINEYTNLVHQGRIGTYAYGDTLFINGSYDKETAESFRINLLTFQKSPWTKLDGYGFEITENLNGIIDTFIVIPNNYTLSDATNTQMVQIAGTFTGANKFVNIYTTIIDKHPVPVTLIDFDAEYPTATGSSLVSNLNDAISRISEGDTILFKSASYDFGGTSFDLEKAVCLCGLVPDSILKDSVGAQNVTTTFNQMKNFNIKSSNVTLSNLKLVPVETIGYVFTRVSHATQHQFYTNIQFNNVIFYGGNAQCYGQNGAGISFRNVSFLNFANIGYACNRTYPHDDLPKSSFDLCHFVPDWDEVFYNTRGISMDAGNDNHPIPWDANGMHIDSCLFDGTGCGWSKGANAKVTNTHFIGYRGDIDMIHFEEYTNNILVENNLFEYSKPSRTFFIDRELQPLSDITIRNNTFKGTYKWIFWGNSQFNLTFEGNDLTQANASDVNYTTFDFTAYHISNNEQAPFTMPMENLILRNNTGIDKTSIGELTINTLKGDDSNIIEDYPESKITKTEVAFKPTSLLDTTKLYRIVNKASGEAMVAVDGTINVQTSAEAFSDSSDIWEVKFIYPYTYTFKNIKTKQYMEIYNIYTLGDYNKEPNELEKYYVEQKSTWEGKERLPHWLLSKVNLTEDGEFQIYPGTNEKKSRVIKSGSDIILDLALDKTNSGIFPANDASTWKFTPVIHVGLDKINESAFQVYPNPAESLLSIQFSESTQELQSLKLYSASGKLVYSKSASGIKTDINIDVQAFERGLYLLEIRSLKHTLVKKIMLK